MGTVEPHASLMICSPLLYRERAPLNCLPCHYKDDSKELDLKLQFSFRRGLSPLTVMIECDALVPRKCGDPAISVHVSVLNAEALKGKNDHGLLSLVEGSPPPPFPNKPVPLTIILLSAKQNLIL